jgi:tetratricopeptide (TPR) repeat protein
MKALFLCLIFTLTCGLPGFAQDTAMLDDANRAYTEGHYDQAAHQFQELIQAHGYSASLCFNLANADAKAGKIGSAILNYERARYLAPSDRDIDQNLQVALRSLTIDQWLGVVDFWLVLIALAVIANFFVNRMTPGANRHLAGRIVKTTLFVAIPLFLFTTYIALLAAPLRIEGVVMSKDAALRLSPFDAAGRSRSARCPRANW